MAEIQTAYWIGDPGPNRVAGATASAPRPGDSPIKTVPCKYRVDKLSAQVNLDVELPTSNRVLWCQPIFKGKDGTSRWLTATSRKLPAPITASEITLVRKPAIGNKAANLKIGAATKIVQGDSAGKTVRVASDTHMTEQVKSIGAETIYSMNLGSINLLTTSNGQDLFPDEGLEATLKQAVMARIDIRADAQGNLVDLKGTVANNIPNPPAMHRYLEHLGRGLELTAIPIPGTALKPGQTWRGGRMPTMAAMTSALPYTFDMVYTYRGVRLVERREMAVIAVDGALRKNLDAVSGQNFDGVRKAEALVEVATGATVLFEGNYRINHKFRFNTGNVQDLQESVDIYFSRGGTLSEHLGPLAAAWCIVEILTARKRRLSCPDARNGGSSRRTRSP